MSLKILKQVFGYFIKEWNMEIRKTPEGYEVTGDIPIVPSGAIVMWHGLIANIPASWVLCDGTNGTPDLRSKFVRGAPAATEAGGTGGEDTHALTVAEMPSHLHTWSGSANGSAMGNTPPDTYGIPWNSSGGNDIPTPHTGGNAAHENRPAYYQILFIMKL